MWDFSISSSNTCSTSSLQMQQVSLFSRTSKLQLMHSEPWPQGMFTLFWGLEKQMIHRSSSSNSPPPVSPVCEGLFKLTWSFDFFDSVSKFLMSVFYSWMEASSNFFPIIEADFLRGEWAVFFGESCLGVLSCICLMVWGLLLFSELFLMNVETILR